MDKLKELRHILFHPEDGYMLLHQKKSGSLLLVICSTLFWFLSTLLCRQYTSFRFNQENTQEYNVFYILLGTVVIFIAFVIANWAVCTLFDGEGSFKEIFVVCGYSIIPYWFTQLLGLALSHILSLEESILITIISTVGLLYSAFMLMIGFIQIHDYSFLKMLLSVLATLIGVLLIIFVAFLVIMLIQEVFFFVKSIIEESLMRGLT